MNQKNSVIMKGNQSSIIGNMQMLMKQKKRETAFTSKIKRIGACFLPILFFNHRRSNNHLHHHLRCHRALPGFWEILCLCICNIFNIKYIDSKAPPASNINMYNVHGCNFHAF